MSIVPKQEDAKTKIVYMGERLKRSKMGMTIDKAIEEVQQQKLDYQEFWEEYKNEHIEALNMAIDTMRKYQKIQEILNSASYTENGTLYSYTYDEDTRVKHIREVVEDGTN